MRIAACLSLALLGLAGCVGHAAGTALRMEEATYRFTWNSGAPGHDYAFDFAGPYLARDRTDTLREGYALAVAMDGGQSYTSHAWLDGSLLVQRQDESCFARLDNGACVQDSQIDWAAPRAERWGLGWAQVAERTGTLPGLTDAPDLALTLALRHDGGNVTLTLHHNGTGTNDAPWTLVQHYHPGELLPFLTESRPDEQEGWRLERTSFRQTDTLPDIAPWPGAPLAVGPAAAGPLPFPDAGTDFLGLGHTAQDALDALTAQDATARAALQGGCVTDYALAPERATPPGPLPVAAPQASTPVAMHRFTLAPANGPQHGWTVQASRDLLGRTQYAVTDNGLSASPWRCPAAPVLARSPLGDFVRRTAAISGMRPALVQVRREPTDHAPSIHEFVTYDRGQEWGLRQAELDALHGTWVHVDLQGQDIRAFDRLPPPPS